MKNFLHLLTLLVCICLFSCSDNCKDLDCGNGTCDDGTCICDEGYEGTNCQTLVIAKYYGTYNNTASSCTNGGQSSMESIILSSAEDSDPTALTVEFELPNAPNPIYVGSIQGNTITASGSYLITTLEFTGTISEDGNTIESNLKFNTLDCDITFSK